MIFEFVGSELIHHVDIFGMNEYCRDGMDEDDKLEMYGGKVVGCICEYVNRCCLLCAAQIVHLGCLEKDGKWLKI